MRRTRVKICGVRRLEDALLAASAGADAVGMVFHAPAARNCPPEVARQIVAALPAGVMPVALFLNASLDYVRQVTADTGIATVQLHGQETPEMVAALAPLGVIKTIRLEPDQESQTLTLWRGRGAGLANLRGLLLETPGSEGGSGQENDWTTIARALQAGLLKDLPPLVVAGGLRPDNVAEVVRRLRPGMVDVSSGVEKSRGVKSRELVETFIRAVREADEAQSEM